MLQFIAGVFLGTAVGISIMCILAAGAEADKEGKGKNNEQH